LRRLAAARQHPVLVAATATIANPVELAGASIEITAVGTAKPASISLRPPLLGDASANEHESVFGEAAAFSLPSTAPASGILFGRARVSVERMLLDVRRLVSPQLAQRVRA
jgi:hypothetical protein